MRQFLFVGLGNPGKKHEKTRHNLGATVVRAWVADTFRVDLNESKVGGWHYVDRWVAEAVVMQLKDVHGEAVTVTCLLPRTGMNESGRAVAAYTSTCSLATHDIVIIHDDLEIPLGVVRLKHGGSAAGHKGVRSVHDALATKELPRVRLGIGRPPQGVDPADFVLQRFSEHEQRVVREMVAEACEALTKVVEEGIKTALPRIGH